MSKPVLSICLITYNQNKYVKQAVDTILMQKVNVPWELIIADDCSTDGTREILQDYEKKFPDHIKLILQKKNVGPESNWLDLMAFPKSKYVLYAEGDDYFTDVNKLQKQIDFLEAHKDFSICFHPVRVIYEDKSRADEIFPTPKLRFNKTVLGVKDLLAGNFIQTNSAMYRWRFTDKSMKTIFPRGIAPGDWFLHLLHAQAGKIGFLNKPMSVYRKHPGGLWWESYADIDKIWQKYGLPHLLLYVEFMNQFGQNPAYRKIIQGHIDRMLNAFIDVDEKYSDNLLKRVMKNFPGVVEPFIISQHEILKANNKIKDDHDNKVRDLEYELAVKENELQTVMQENKMIKSSKVWKMRNKAAVAIGKKAV